MRLKKNKKYRFGIIAGETFNSAAIVYKEKKDNWVSGISLLDAQEVHINLDHIWMIRKINLTEDPSLEDLILTER